MSRVIVRVFLNGQSISVKPMNSQDNLKTVREKLKEKISVSQQFLSKDGDLIDINDEDSFTIGDIIDSSRIINIKETIDKKGIKIKLNDEIISTIELDKKTKISDIRKLIQNIPETAHFYTPENEIIEKEDEEQFLVEDIINNDEINLKKEKENTVEMDIVTAGIYLNGKPSGERQLNKNSSLSDIRKEIENVKNIPKEFVFEDQKGSKIEKDKEQTLKLTSILYDNKINITEKIVPVISPSNTKVFDAPPKLRYNTSLNNAILPFGSPRNTVISYTSPNDTTDVPEKNVPIKGSIRLKNHEEGKLKIYLYPNKPFNPKDENDAIAILVVGQTGSGKTTLLNKTMLKKLQGEYYEIQIDCYDKQQRILECVNILSSIALNNKVTSSNEYLDQLIETENIEKKPGYKSRIRGYLELKKTNEMIEDIIKKSTTQKSREEIKAELERKMNELKQGDESTLVESIQKL
ncbi:hypothetical protein EDI_147640 [Entamoeba dispar SAW760]|uniref:NB-ARC domain-containing protein n=1 Tax=Entamoeba dispar (strain ATCC PRA-260 / SAW760) TaxID=370354 RepID=B0E948_ENTDS|nr:uncharacterized protein EDI_147640 [Entamoeba dispar SAW760]EDR28950.1 hypothetical protein EDI_147640 [Entamoeba dispar SAW760]|eukprot:EDR28950.1 hypothetical protein EDI_147640 [Entamoeba dispar SAW760]